MHYRPFGQLEWDVSALGFGTMRLPVLDGDTSMIDEEETARMLRTSIDAGVNYVDTAYPYHGGKSEECVGRILGDGYREKVKLAT
ncbi:MAG: aldo/keto reductase, partial [Spirochaetota bacterium]|nr:aldo/keto reductase [Spirochaetota bacterium]